MTAGYLIHGMLSWMLQAGDGIPPLGERLTMWVGTVFVLGVLMTLLIMRAKELSSKDRDGR